MEEIVKIIPLNGYHCSLKEVTQKVLVDCEMGNIKFKGNVRRDKSED